MLEDGDSAVTPSTEVYVPPSTYRVNAAARKAQQVQRSLFQDEQTLASQSVDSVAAGDLERRTTGKRAKPGPGRRRKRKMKTCELLAATEEDVLALASAGAEGVVLAAVREICAADEVLSPGATLEVAVQLRRARQSMGLDEFFFGIEDGIYWGDVDWMEGLEDSAMQEAFADVGLSVTLDQAASVSEGKELVATFGRRLNAGEVTRPAALTVSQVNCGVNDTVSIESADAVKSGRGNYFNRMWNEESPLLKKQQEKPSRAFLGGHGKRVHRQREQLEYSNLTESRGIVDRCGSPEQSVTCGGVNALPLKTLVLKSARTQGNFQLDAPDSNERTKFQVAPSQNSVSCSHSCLRDPLCSFVPCTLDDPVSTASPSQPCNNPQSAYPHAIVDVVNTRLLDQEKDLDVICTLQAPNMCTVENHGEKQPVIRGCSISAQPLGSLLHPVVVTSGDQEPERILLAEFSEPPAREKMGCSGEVENVSADYQHSFLESPPLRWPRSKKSRLQACRVVDTQLETISFHGVLTEAAAREKEECNGEEQNSIPYDHGVIESPPFIWPRAKRSRLRADRVPDAEQPCIWREGDMHSIPIMGNFGAPTRSNHGVNCPEANGAPLSCKQKKQSGDMHFSEGNYQLASAATADVQFLAAPPNRIRTYRRKNKWQGVTHRHRLPEAGCESRGRPKAREPSKLFKGLQFLLTGFELDKKNDLANSIEKHGGSVLKEVPPPSALQARLSRQTGRGIRRPPIVIASRQVRTTKFLYGCAVGWPPLLPSWIYSSISVNECLPYTEYEHTSSPPINKECMGSFAQPIFVGVRALLHGQTGFRARLSALVEHGGGRILNSMKQMKVGVRTGANVMNVIIVENRCDLSPRHKTFALKSSLPILSGEWVVQSLLSQSLLPAQAFGDKEMQVPDASRPLA